MSEQPFRNIDDISQENSSNRNESLDNVGNLNPSSFAVGKGNKAMFSDERGTWWGHQDPNKALIFFGMNGVAKLRASALNSLTGFEFFDLNGKKVIRIGFKNV